MVLDKLCSNGFFHIVALDHRESLRRMIKPENPEAVTRKDMEIVKLRLAKIFCEEASGILLDPIYGKPAIRVVKRKCGLILALEESGYEDGEYGRLTKLIKGFGPREAVKLGADAAKLLIYFNPKAKTAKKQKELVKEVARECEDVGLPLICEFLVYPLDEKNFEEEKSELIIKSVKQISRLGIQLLKVEFPGKIGENREILEKRCEKITESSEVPWVLLSRGVDFEEFKEQLKISINCGASGFMVGRALWQDYFKPGIGKREFLRVECLRRLNELKKIAS
ncbi:MAG: tagatose 1,6-diphosphate aldolase [Candidatus Aenigmatarchaeota archaeon]